MLSFADYQQYHTRFSVNRDMVQQAIATCQPSILEALTVHAQRHLWRGDLPVYPVLTTPADNGGWGHLMPVWFKPHERPIPVHALDNWALFALVYAHSFGPSAEAQDLLSQYFNVDNLMQVVIGNNLQIPFLPSTQGRGRFFRHGMLPFLLSMLWLKDDARQAWLRLHQLGAQTFIASHNLADMTDPLNYLTDLEYTIFSRLERNSVTSDEAVAAFLAEAHRSTVVTVEAPLINLYQSLFGAIAFGVTALATYYQAKALSAWSEWVPKELAMPYRLHDYGGEAISQLLN